MEIVTCLDLAIDLNNLYGDGMPPGDSTGWPDVDEFYTVAPGFWTVITGVPSHGKSTWMDNLMLNLIRQGWKFIIYSPETQPHAMHLAHLLEKWLHRPFRKGFNRRMAPADIAEAINELDGSLRILRIGEEKLFPTLDSIMETADEILGYWQGERVGVIIDPWNELDHTPLLGMTETQVINHELMCWRQWVRGRQVHGFIIAHPQKPQRDRNGNLRRVGLYDINGSAAWYNKSDHGIIIHREEDVTEIEIEKCRFRHLGKKGSAFLRFESGTGNYYDQLTRERRFGGFHQVDDPF